MAHWGDVSVLGRHGQIDWDLTNPSIPLGCSARSTLDDGAAMFIFLKVSERKSREKER